MARRRSYDVKSFLNKRKSRSGFISLTVSGSALTTVISLAAIVIFSLAACRLLASSGFFEFLLRAGVSNALPFLSSQDRQLLMNEFDINSPNLFAKSVSPLLQTKENKATPPDPPAKNIPDVNIETTQNPSQGIEVKNETEYLPDVRAVLSEGVTLVTDNPKVLIVHTHGSESYTSSKAYKYEQTGNYRTQDTDYNMIRVGEELTRHLKQKGIDVIHDKTINDYPSYNDSYNKTEKVIKNHLSQDSDIVFVFDIHRDAVGEGDNIVKFVSEVKGEKAAQVMIVCGTDTNLDNPLWRQNFALAVHIQNYFEVNTPGLFRPLNLRKERFNMHLTTGSLLFEVGTNGNTLDEALSAARYLGDGLGEIINNLKNNG